jgi:hypothetical protein
LEVSEVESLGLEEGSPDTAERNCIGQERILPNEAVEKIVRYEAPSSPS